MAEIRTWEESINIFLSEWQEIADAKWNPLEHFAEIAPEITASIRQRIINWDNRIASLNQTAQLNEDKWLKCHDDAKRIKLKETAEVSYWNLKATQNAANKDCPRGLGGREWEIGYDAYLKTEWWNGRRILTINHYGARCQECRVYIPEITINQAPLGMHVHHLKGDKIGYFNLWREQVGVDIILLCEICHKKIHGR